MEKVTVNNYYVLLTILKNIIENYQQLIKIYAVNEYEIKVNKKINR